MINIKTIFLITIVLLLTACGTTTQQKNPNLKKVGNYPHITWIKEKMILSKNNKNLFVVNQDTSNKVDILDLTDLTQPKLLIQIICSENIKDRIMDYKITHNGKYLFVTISNNILIYNVENIKNIRLINKVPLYNADSLIITPNDKYLYISGSIRKYSRSLIYIYNIQNIQNIQNIGNYTQDGYMLTISPNGKKLAYGISATQKERLGLADISNPVHPILLDQTGEIFNNRGKFSTSARLKEIVFSKNSKKIYIAGNEVGLMVYDISKNKLDNIQLTAGTHSKMILNSTESIYSISLDREKNILYLSGVLNKNIKYIKTIKGVSSSILTKSGSNIVSKRGDFLILGSLDGLDFYLIQATK